MLAGLPAIAQDGLKYKVVRTTHSLLNHLSSDLEPSAAPADPFADLDARDGAFTNVEKLRFDAVDAETVFGEGDLFDLRLAPDWLEDNAILAPKHLIYNRSLGLIFIAAEPNNADLIEAFVQPLCCIHFKYLRIEVQALVVDGDTWSDVDLNGHVPDDFADILLSEEKAERISHMLLSCKSGQRAGMEIEKLKEDRKTTVRLESVIGANGRTIDIQLDYQLNDPEFNAKADTPMTIDAQSTGFAVLDGARPDPLVLFVRPFVISSSSNNVSDIKLREMQEIWENLGPSFDFDAKPQAAADLESETDGFRAAVFRVPSNFASDSGGGRPADPFADLDEKPAPPARGDLVWLPEYRHVLQSGRCVDARKILRNNGIGSDKPFVALYSPTIASLFFWGSYDDYLLTDAYTQPLDGTVWPAIHSAVALQKGGKLLSLTKLITKSGQRSKTVAKNPNASLELELDPVVSSSWRVADFNISTEIVLPNTTIKSAMTIVTPLNRRVSIPLTLDPDLRLEFLPERRHFIQSYHDEEAAAEILGWTEIAEEVSKHKALAE